MPTILEPRKRRSRRNVGRSRRNVGRSRRNVGRSRRNVGRSRRNVGRRNSIIQSGGGRTLTEDVAETRLREILNSKEVQETITRAIEQFRTDLNTYNEGTGEGATAKQKLEHFDAVFDSMKGRVQRKFRTEIERSDKVNSDDNVDNRMPIIQHLWSKWKYFVDEWATDILKRRTELDRRASEELTELGPLFSGRQSGKTTSWAQYLES